MISWKSVERAVVVKSGMVFMRKPMACAPSAWSWVALSPDATSPTVSGAKADADRRLSTSRSCRRRDLGRARTSIRLSSRFSV